MWRGADAVARDLCEAIVIDGSSLIKSLSKLFASLCGRQRVSLSPLQ